MTGSGADLTARTLAPGDATGDVLRLDTPVSFWGGVDETGTIVDVHHPQCGERLTGKIDFLMGFIIGLKAFTAAVIGGIGNIKGAMLGGLTLGMLESFGTAWLGGEWRDVFAFAFLILFLTVRPTGILGERVTERV